MDGADKCGESAAIASILNLVLEGPGVKTQREETRRTARGLCEPQSGSRNLLKWADLTP